MVSVEDYEEQLAKAGEFHGVRILSYFWKLIDAWQMQFKLSPDAPWVKGP